MQEQLANESGNSQCEHGGMLFLVYNLLTTLSTQQSHISINLAVARFNKHSIHTFWLTL